MSKEQTHLGLGCTEDGSTSLSLAVALCPFVSQWGNFWCAGAFNATRC